MSAPVAILRTEARLFRREPAAVFWVLCFPTLLLCILGAIPSFRDPAKGVDGVALVALYTNIVILTSMAMAALQGLPSVLTTYRERGILRRISTTPASPGAVMGAQFVIELAAVICSSLLALVVARVVFDVDLPRQFAGFLLAFVLSAASMLALGSVISAIAPNVKVASALGTIAFFPMLFTAGMWVPVAAMPHGLQRAVEYFPLGAGVRALDQAAAGSWPGADHLAVVVVWTAVLGVIAVRRFRWQ